MLQHHNKWPGQITFSSKMQRLGENTFVPKILKSECRTDRTHEAGFGCCQMLVDCSLYVYASCLQRSDCTEVGGLSARLQTCFSRTINNWWKSVKILGENQRKELHFCSFYLWMLLSMCHLFLQEVLRRLQAVLLDTSLCNDKETSVMYAEKGRWGMTSLKLEKKNPVTKKPQQTKLFSESQRAFRVCADEEMVVMGWTVVG